LPWPSCSATSRCGSLALTLNTLIDAGETAYIDDVVQHLADGTLLTWLAERYDGASLGLFGQADLDAMLERFRQCHAASSGQRMYGVENNGLSLMLAWCLGVLFELQAHAEHDRAHYHG
jgi:hypothetical protein